MAIGSARVKKDKVDAQRSRCSFVAIVYPPNRSCLWTCMKHANSFDTTPARMSIHGWGDRGEWHMLAPEHFMVSQALVTSPHSDILFRHSVGKLAFRDGMGPDVARRGPQ
jgi:hypothetical protein